MKAPTSSQRREMKKEKTPRIVCVRTSKGAKGRQGGPRKRGGGSRSSRFGRVAADGPTTVAGSDAFRARHARPGTRVQICGRRRVLGLRNANARPGDAIGEGRRRRMTC